MIVSLTLAVLTAPIFGYSAPVLARRVQPAQATWLLALGGLVSAFTSGTALTMLAFLLLGRAPALSEYWGWSFTTLERENHVPTVVSMAALIILVVLVGRAVRACATWARALRRCYVLAAALGTADLVVTADAGAQAVALPGRPGKIVLSRSLITQLDPLTRKVVIAHEQAHLRHRHHWAMSAGVISAAANPCLTPVLRALVLSTERWADEDASREVDRGAVAAAIIQFRSASSRDAPDAALSAVSRGRPTTRVGCIQQRIVALLVPPVTGASWRRWTLTALSLAPIVVSGWSWWHVERLYELAQTNFLTVG